MKRPDWDEVWMSLAVVVGQRSRCAAKVGAVIVGPGNRYVQPGYAGPPANFVHAQILPDDATCDRYCQRNQKPLEERDPAYRDCASVHAEMNAAILADRSQIENGTFYISAVPCFSCIKVIGNSGVGRCVYILDAEAEGTGRDEYHVHEFLSRCGIRVDRMPDRPENSAVKILGTEEN